MLQVDKTGTWSPLFHAKHKDPVTQRERPHHHDIRQASFIKLLMAEQYGTFRFSQLRKWGSQHGIKLQNTSLALQL
jgi:hypothetical protein